MAVELKLCLFCLPGPRMWVLSSEFDGAAGAVCVDQSLHSRGREREREREILSLYL